MDPTAEGHDPNGADAPAAVTSPTASSASAPAAAPASASAVSTSLFGERVKHTRRAPSSSAAPVESPPPAVPFGQSVLKRRDPAAIASPEPASPSPSSASAAAAPAASPFGPSVLKPSRRAPSNADQALNAASPEPACASASPFGPSVLKSAARPPPPASVASPEPASSDVDQATGLPFVVSLKRTAGPRAPAAILPRKTPAPFSPAQLADADERDHAPRIEPDAHRVAAPDLPFLRPTQQVAGSDDAVAPAPVDESGMLQAEIYFHRRQREAMEAKKAAAEVERKRKARARAIEMGLEVEPEEPAPEPTREEHVRYVPRGPEPRLTPQQPPRIQTGNAGYTSGVGAVSSIYSPGPAFPELSVQRVDQSAAASGKGSVAGGADSAGESTTFGEGVDLSVRFDDAAGASSGSGSLVAAAGQGAVASGAEPSLHSGGIASTAGVGASRSRRNSWADVVAASIDAAAAASTHDAELAPLVGDAASVAHSGGHSVRSDADSTALATSTGSAPDFVSSAGSFSAANSTATESDSTGIAVVAGTQPSRSARGSRRSSGSAGEHGASSASYASVAAASAVNAATSASASSSVEDDADDAAPSVRTMGALGSEQGRGAVHSSSQDEADLAAASAAASDDAPQATLSAEANAAAQAASVRAAAEALDFARIMQEQQQQLQAQQDKLAAAEAAAAEKQRQTELEATEAAASKAQHDEEKRRAREAAAAAAAEAEAERARVEQAEQARVVEEKRLADELVAAEAAAEADRLERDRVAAAEQQRAAKERRAAELAAAEAAAAEAERLRLEHEQQDRLAEEKRAAKAAKKEAARLKKEQEAQAAAAAAAAAAAEAAAAEEAERVRLEQLERDRLAEEQRLAAEKQEAERLRKEQEDADRAAAAAAAAATAEAEAERLKLEKQAAAQRETARIAEEQRVAEERRVAAAKQQADADAAAAAAAAAHRQQQEEAAAAQRAAAAEKAAAAAVAERVRLAQLAEQQRLAEEQWAAVEAARLKREEVEAAEVAERLRLEQSRMLVEAGGSEALRAPESKRGQVAAKKAARQRKEDENKAAMQAAAAAAATAAAAQVQAAAAQAQAEEAERKAAEYAEALALAAEIEATRRRDEEEESAAAAAEAESESERASQAFSPTSPAAALLAAAVATAASPTRVARTTHSYEFKSKRFSQDLGQRGAGGGGAGGVDVAAGAINSSPAQHQRLASSAAAGDNASQPRAAAAPSPLPLAGTSHTTHTISTHTSSFAESKSSSSSQHHHSTHHSHTMTTSTAGPTDGFEEVSLLARNGAGPQSTITILPATGAGAAAHTEEAATQQQQSQQQGLTDGPDGCTWWSCSAEAVGVALRSDVTSGLTEVEAAARLKSLGPNALPTTTLSLWFVLKEELREPLIILLFVIAALYALWGRLEEALTACTIILLTISLEIWSEWRAKSAMALLAAAEYHPPVAIWRAGGLHRVPPAEVVPGDIQDLSAGERAVADGRLLASTWTMVDESGLTGESRGVPKDATVILAPQAAMHQRRNMIYRGSLVLHGSARVMIVATGPRTFEGRVESAASSARLVQRSVRTPLQVRMKELSVRLTVVAALACMLVMSLGFMRGVSYRSVMLTGLALAFATIPEELPLLIKAVLAGGAIQLSRRGVLLKSLKIAEALGGVSLLLTDKTGTLTRNRLSLLRLAMPGKMLKVPRSRSSDDGEPAGSCEPFQASTEDILAFEPLLEQGWMMSSPTLVDALTIHKPATLGPDAGFSPRSNASSHSQSSGNSMPSPYTPRSAAAAASDILSYAFSARGVLGGGGGGLNAPAGSGQLDPFDASFLRFFAATRSHPRDLNSVFLRKLFADSFRVAQYSTLLHVLPYDHTRRRSSTIRRIHQAGGITDVGPLRLCCRGGAEFVLSACVYSLHSNGSIMTINSEVRAELQATLRSLSEQGLRVMGFAVRQLLQDDLDNVEQQIAAANAAQAKAAMAAGNASAMQTDEEGEDQPAGHRVPLGAPLPHSSGSKHGRVPSVSSISSLHSPLYTSFERHMTFLGFVAFGDEIRPGVETTIAQLQQAGIEVKLVTGDHQRTGAAVARVVGILKTPSAPAATTSAAAPSSLTRHGRKGSRDHLHSLQHPPVVSLGEDELSVPGVCVGRSHHNTPAHSRCVSRAPSAANVNIHSAMQTHQPTHSRGMSRTTSSGSLSSLTSVHSVVEYDTAASVYCRMTPLDKLSLVRSHQALGHTVMVSGDGLNDGPFLAASDAGLAMGSSGTDVAREYADLILTTDDFRSVVIAVREGRRSLRNLSKAVRFYLSCKLALVLLFLLPLALGWDLPLSPLHVILLECLLDLGASAAFTTEPAPESLMRRSPGLFAKDKFMRGWRYTAGILAAAALLIAAVGLTLIAAHNMTIVPGSGAGSSSSSGGRAHAHATMHLSGWSPSVDEYADFSAHGLLASSSSSSLPGDGPSNSERAIDSVVRAGDDSIDTAPGESKPVPHAHSSNNFFPDLLPRFQADPHLRLTHSMVFVAWLLASVMLAVFMRSERSFWLSCCDATSLRRMRARRRTRREQAYFEPKTVGPAAAAAPNAACAPTTAPQSLAQAVEEGRLGGGYGSQLQGASSSALHHPEPGLGAHAAFLPADRGGGYASDDDSVSSSGSAAATPLLHHASSSVSIAELEGLHRRPGAAHRSASIASLSSASASLAGGGHEAVIAPTSLRATVCPLLFSNGVMLAWIACSCLFALAAVTSPWLRSTLQLAPLDVRVRMDAITGTGASFPAWVVAVSIPSAVFFLAELAKYLLSFQRAFTHSGGGNPYASTTPI